MKIETPRLTLRDFTPADGPALHAILGDGEVMAFAEPPYTPAQSPGLLGAVLHCPPGRLGLRGESHRPAGGLPACFPPWGSRCGSWGGFSAETPGAKALPPRQAGRCFATLSKPSPPGRSSPKPSTLAGLPCAGETVVSPGRRPAGGNRPPGGGPCCINTPFVPRIGNGKNRNGAGKFQRCFSLPC